MKKIILLLVVALVLSSVFVVAAEETYVVGVENINYYPYSTVKDGEYQGFAREVLDLFAEKSGYKFIYKPLPVKRLFMGLVNKKIDFKYPDNPYWGQDMKQGTEIQYSEEVVKYIDGVLVKPKNKGKKVEQIRSLGIVRGFTPYDYLDRIKSGKIRLIKAASFASSLKLGINNRVDGVYSNIAVARYFLKEEVNQPNALVYDPSLPHSKSAYHLSTAQHTQVINEFNKFLKDNKEEIKKLKEKYKVIVD
ncbi:substrate-binding periplasmic protein [Halanaerobacter jeridensis]|uniref:ABC-type amino acid transport substrate-binding protein n=1 Tax=Halanaerobacter jeridensis TaxID=706427 RepID=A0A938XQG0_9FIRM|nr:transporter substrate-binding domain-containing protein [Halanaerobacter jeridensis]MBM7557968.1 ABC-type amino acid transport substrate-binding protein [Halanaerobacter jeridensis]